MTTKITLWFECKVCKALFLSYCMGKYLPCYYDMIHTEGICFYDHRIGEIHDNHVLNSLKNIRKCRKCSKGNQLEDYI